jgi:nitrite reductase (cytochrome c-552)
MQTLIKKQQVGSKRQTEGLLSDGEEGGSMWKKGLVALAVVMVTIVGLPVSKGSIAADAKQSREGVGKEDCYGCHEEVKALKEGSRHANLGCVTCHDNLVKHAESQGDVKPVTKIDAAVCGKCHKDQYDSFRKVSHEAAARKEKGVPIGRSPMQDKLLAGHGFTFEHNEPRGHAFMVIDQFVVDRFQGGRFQFKKGWRGSMLPARPGTS